MVFRIFKQGAAPEEATRFTFYETIGKLFPAVTNAGCRLPDTSYQD